MKARIRNTRWVVSAVVGLTLFLMPTIVVLIYPAVPITAALLSIPRCRGVEPRTVTRTRTGRGRRGGSSA